MIVIDKIPLLVAILLSIYFSIKMKQIDYEDYYGTVNDMELDNLLKLLWIIPIIFVWYIYFTFFDC